MTLAWIYWDSDPVMFTLPVIDHPVRWYGLLFVLGFYAAYLLVKRILSVFLQHHGREKDAAAKEGLVLADKLAIYLMIGTIIGARLGHCLFYEWERYAADPLSILWTWEGGLASHGGSVGIILALMIFHRLHRKKYPWLTGLTLADIVAVPIGLTGFFIRLGNFVNQEITGTMSTLPWAVKFGHPADGSISVPRHPVQIYEGLAYLVIFALLLRIWKQQRTTFRRGLPTGVLLVLIFVSRLLLEHFKLPQSTLVSADSLMNMGQLLSIPFILAGGILIANAYRRA